MTDKQIESMMSSCSHDIEQCINELFYAIDERIDKKYISAKNYEIIEFAVYSAIKNAIKKVITKIEDTK